MLSIKEKWEKQQKESLETYLTWAGDVATLAKILGESNQTVTNWFARGRMSARSACKAERLDDAPLPKEVIRPDVMSWDCDKYLKESK